MKNEFWKQILPYFANLLTIRTFLGKLVFYNVSLPASLFYFINSRLSWQTKKLCIVYWKPTTKDELKLFKSIIKQCKNDYKKR